MPGGMAPTEVFEAARKTLHLADEAEKGVALLEGQFADEFEAAVNELRLTMAKAYVAKVLALLPDEEKPKYEAVAKALMERDEAMVAAQKELKTALDQVKANQGVDKAPRDNRRPRFGPPGGVRNGKLDILRSHFALTDEQQQLLDGLERDARDAVRQQMEPIFANLRDAGRPPDPNTFRQIGQIMRQAMEKADDETARVVAELLTAEQKKDYTAACAAIDTSRNKTKDAEEACRKKTVEAVGEEKAAALLGPPPGAAVVKPKAGTAF